LGEKEGKSLGGGEDDHFHFSPSYHGKKKRRKSEEAGRSLPLLLITEERKKGGKWREYEGEKPRSPLCARGEGGAGGVKADDCSCRKSIESIIKKKEEKGEGEKRSRGKRKMTRPWSYPNIVYEKRGKGKRKEGKNAEAKL